VAIGQPPQCASHSPVSSWVTAAGVVNHQSARTTIRLTSACVAMLPLRLAKNMV